MSPVKFLAIIAVSMLLTTCSLGITSAKQNKTIDTLKLEDKYRLHLVDVDADGEKCWLDLIKNVVIDNEVVAAGEFFEFYDNEHLIVVGHCEAIFTGLDSYAVRLTDIKQYDEFGNIIFTQEEVLLITKK